MNTPSAATQKPKFTDALDRYLDARRAYETARAANNYFECETTWAAYSDAADALNAFFENR